MSDENFEEKEGYTDIADVLLEMMSPPPRANLLVVECYFEDEMLEPFMEVRTFKTDAYQLSNRLVRKIVELVSHATLHDDFVKTGKYNGRKHWSSSIFKDLSDHTCITVSLINNKDLPFISEGE